ncbi:MAG: RIP metalloprotease RseP [Thermodesulfobacteriota bacterium]
MTTLFALIIVLGVLIFFHELGHFLVARLFGVGVEKFSLGFGPRLFGFKSGITDYQVSAIPLGGYVKMVGEDPDAEEELSEADIPLSFTHKHVAKRFCIVAAGPVFNMLLAVLIFYGLFQVYGMAHLQPVIGDVTDGSPAHAAGLMAGDRVVAVDDAAVASWEEMALMIRDSNGRMLRLTVQRGDGLLKVDVRPDPAEGASIFGEPQTHYRIGVAASGEVVRERLNPVAALRQSVTQTWEVVRLTAIGVGKMFSGTVSAKNLGGPILIAQMAGEQARQGSASLLAFIAFISINLAILNILPIPVLDGGHLLFFAIEAVRGKPVSIRTREKAQQVGLFVILLLMVLVMYNDISRFFE